MREIAPNLALWKRVQQAHEGEPHPPKRTGAEMVGYLSACYPLEPVSDPLFSAVVLSNLEEYPYAALPAEPRIAAFRVLPTAAGAALYEHRDHAVYGDIPILVGIELESGYLYCEGSDELQDALFLQQGLSDQEWENPFLAWRMLTRCQG